MNRPPPKPHPSSAAASTSAAPEGVHATPADARDERARPEIPRRVWRATLLLVAGRLFGSLCTFTALFVLARHLEKAAFDRYTFYLAVFMLLDALVDFGTGQVAVQRTAHDEDAVPEVLAATRRIRFGTGLLGVVLVGGGALAFGEPGAGWILVASLYPVTHVFELSNTVFRNRIAFGIPVLARALASAASLTFVGVLVALGDREPAHFLVATALGSTSANVFLWFATRAHLPRRAATHVPTEEILAAALPLGVAGLCQQAYFYVDNLFVRAWCPDGDLGAYGVAMRVLSILIMGALYATQAALPWLAREHRAGRLGPAVARLAQPLFAGAGLVTGLVAPWSETLLAPFGEHFPVAGSSLRWLLAATTVIHAGAAFMTALVAAGHMRTILAVAALALAVNLLANTWLVPALGIEGAAIATLATEGAVTVMALVALRRAKVDVSGGARAWAWCGGPIGFALGWWASAAFVPAT